MSSEYQRQRVSSWLRRWAGRSSRVCVVYDGETVAEVLLVDEDGKRIGDNDAADALCDAAEDCAAAAGRAVTVSIRALSDQAGAGPLAQMPYRAMATGQGDGANVVAQLLAQNHAFARANLELMGQQMTQMHTMMDCMARMMEASTNRALAEAARADAANAQAREAIEVAEEVSAKAKLTAADDTKAQLGGMVIRLLEPRLGAVLDAAGASMLNGSGEPS